MRRRAIPIVVTLALVVTAIPNAVLASHEVTDERPTTTLEDFRDDVGSWVDPWVENSGSDFSDDHAPLVAIELYEELLGIKPEGCYLDTYAAYWAVAADLRALGQAPTRGQMEVATMRALESVDRAEALAQLSATHCAVSRPAVDEVVEVTVLPGRDQKRSPDTGPARVIEIESTASLQFTDGSGDQLEEITVAPGEIVIFRVHNSAGFDHNFYIGTASELEEPAGTTDAGIPAWVTGVRDLEWTVPDDVSGLMFGCTVPGHFPSTHGIFTVARTGDDDSSG
jgi:hypothetical protein